MAPSTKPPTKGKRWWPGVLVGVFLSAVTVLASGFMLEVTNTDSFCVTCHAMQPFRNSWRQATHGGANAKGLEAQCVDCHLPHGDFTEFVTAKAITGTRDLFLNLIIDPATYDWAGRAQSRREFTYDNACRACHNDLTPKGMRTAGILAHRQYLLGDLDKRCVDCHEHVGHENMITQAKQYFGQLRLAQSEHE